MKKNFQSAFRTRQYMISRDFEIYYYNDCDLLSVPLHSHDYYEFYFFIEGDVSVQIGKEVFPIKSGDILLVPPKLPHRPILHSQKTPYQRFVFWISQEYYQHLRQQSSDYAYLINYVQANREYIFHNDIITFRAIHSKILRLLKEIHVPYFGQATQISLCVSDLILSLNRLIYEQKHPSKSTEEPDLFQQLTEYIEEHISENLSLNAIANEFFVSKYYIAHIFKANLGMSVHQYITKKRLSLCREAILGKASITKIYQMFGFGDYSSFYRAFKKEYGISPNECRRHSAPPSDRISTQKGIHWSGAKS